MTPRTHIRIAALLLGTLVACAHAGKPGVPPFATKGLIMSRYAGEETGSVFGTKVFYFDAAERRRFLLTIKHGLLYKADGKKLTTKKDGAIFVMDGDGVFYASEEQAAGVFHHSSFLAGRPIAAAGVIHAKRGRLTMLTDKSGHYEPPVTLTKQALLRLRAMGVPLSTVDVSLEGAGEVSAEACLSLPD